MFCNQWTLSLLAGLCDIYNAYGNLVNVVQMFRLFPHQRYEKFLSELAKMRQISDHITESNCSNKTCPLKFYHGAKKSLESGGMIGQIVVVDVYPTKGAGMNTETRSSQKIDESEILPIGSWVNVQELPKTVFFTFLHTVSTLFILNNYA